MAPLTEYKGYHHLVTPEIWFSELTMINHLKTFKDSYCFKTKVCTKCHYMNTMSVC